MITDKSKEGRRTYYTTVIIIAANPSAVATMRIKYNRATHYSIIILNKILINGLLEVKNLIAVIFDTLQRQCEDSEADKVQRGLC
jgi:hypothetical protein